MTEPREKQREPRTDEGDDRRPEVSVDVVQDLDASSDADDIRGGKCIAGARYTAPSNTTN
jgi:hypothetical protein